MLKCREKVVNLFYDFSASRLILEPKCEHFLVFIFLLKIMKVYFLIRPATYYVTIRSGLVLSLGPEQSILDQPCTYKRPPVGFIYLFASFIFR